MSEKSARIGGDPLQCRWLAWRVIGPDALALDLPEKEICWMDRTIRVAEYLMPTVTEVRAFSGGIMIARYEWGGTEWKAHGGAR